MCDNKQRRDDRVDIAVLMVIAVCFLAWIIGATIAKEDKVDVPALQEFEVLCDDGYRRYHAEQRFPVKVEKAMCEVDFN